MREYINYEREKYLKDFNEILGLQPIIEDYAEKIIEKGIDNLVFCGVGGTYAIMMPMEVFAKKHTTMPVYLENAAELVLGMNKAITDKSLVLLYSDSGTTKETIEAAEYCRKNKITTIGVSCTEGKKLQELLDYPIVSTASDYYSCDGDYMRLYMIVGALLNKLGDFPEYKDFMDNLKKLPTAMADTKEEVEDDVTEYAGKIKDEPYHIIVGSGNLWGPTYCYGMCILEEMQWIRTKTIKAPEFFHGTLELLEKDTSVIIFKGEDETRGLTERVERFVPRISEKMKVFDTKNYGRNAGIDEKYRADFSPALIEAVMGRLSAHVEIATGHSLDIRRYYRVMDY